MQKEYLISELKPGMFVEEVIQQSGDLKIKSKGLVRTQRAIAQLAKQGVEKVLVDLDKSRLKKEPEAVVEPVKAKEKTEKPKTVSFDEEIGQASKLYEKAQVAQNQAIKNLKAGKPINTKAMKEVANGFVDSVFRNQDALACMTRMRQKDQYLMEHSINTSIIISIFAKHLGIDKTTVHQLATGALLHDLGKVGIPDAILHKPGSLDVAEMDQMKTHVQLGYDVLLRSGELNPVSLEVISDHHERLDGSGYPARKSGDEVGQYSRMMAIVDSYDAMTSDQIYRKARSPLAAFKVLNSETGTSYDEKLVASFINCMGIHPVGTLVRMKSNKLGIVIKSNHVNPIAPIVQTFYSINNKCYIEPKIVDIAAVGVTDEIDKSVRPEDYKIDMIKFFREILIN